MTSVRVEYTRSFEYSLEWSIAMYRQRSSRVSKTSVGVPRRSPSPDEELTQRSARVRRRRTALGEAKTDNCGVKAHRGQSPDLIDIINGVKDDKRIAEEDGEFVQVLDEGVDNLDEDRRSVASSIASGPSLEHSAAAKTPGASQDVCSACRKLCKRAEKMKAPIKSKVLDRDPKSLNCDQWVLIKNRRSSRWPNIRGKLLNCVQLVKKRLKVENEQFTEEEEPSACSRPHTFLKRNLRRCVGAPVKREGKKSRRKRTREDSQGPRVSKQKRLHSGSRRQHGSANGHGEGRDRQRVADRAETQPTVGLTPFKVTPEPEEVPAKQKAPKRTRGFGDLLTQMRGNNSMIIRETC